MGTITSSVGLISGINTGQIVDELMQIESQPVQVLQTQLDSTNEQQQAYSDLATGGRTPALSSDTLAQLTAPPRPPSAVARDQVLLTDASFSLGFARPGPGFSFGSSKRALGHPGAGGSFAFADPDLGLSFAYAPNRLGHHLRDDPREKALRDTLYLCTQRLAKSTPTRASARP